MAKFLRGLSLAVALAGALVAGAAHAALYNSHFDPIDAVSFVGDGRFYVDDDCLLLDDVYAGEDCNARLEFADVDLTVTSSPPNVGDSGHLHFGMSTDIINVIIEGGELVGVNSFLIGPSFAAPCSGAVCGSPWWIQWEAPILTAARVSATDPVNLYTGTCGPIDLRLASPKADVPIGCSNDESPVGIAYDVTFTRIAAVPEPGSLALLGAGALVAWVARRRRSAR